MQSNSSQPLKLLIFGAGAIGTYIGGSLVLMGHQVVFLEQPAVAEDLRQRALRLDLSVDKRREGQDAIVIPPTAVVFAASLDEVLRYGPFDVGIFALKSFDTLTLLRTLEPYADKMPPLLCLSNGVENEPEIALALGVDKVIHGTVTSAIGRRGPGDIVLEKLRGMGVAAGHPLSERLVSALDAAYLNCRMFPNAASMKWSKLLTNLLANPTSAILDMTAAEVFANRDLYQLELQVLRECLAVMEAQDIPVTDLPGTPVRLLALAAGMPWWLSKPFLSKAAGAGRGGKMPSFHIDLHSGRGQSEVEYLHGAVARFGEKLDVPAPVNHVLTDTLLKLTRGEIPLESFAHSPAKLLSLIHPKKE